MRHMYTEETCHCGQLLENDSCQGCGMEPHECICEFAAAIRTLKHRQPATFPAVHA